MAQAERLQADRRLKDQGDVPEIEPAIAIHISDGVLGGTQGREADR